MASIEQAIDVLLVSVNDPCVQKSLQDSITRVDLKFKDLISRVHGTEDTPVQRYARLVPSTQHRPHEVTPNSGRAHNMTADTIRALTKQVYKYRTQYAPSTEIRLLSAELERAKKRVVQIL